MHSTNTFCQICGQAKPDQDLLPALSVRPGIVRTIEAQGYAWDENGYICRLHREQFRSKYILQALSGDRGEITALEQRVLQSLRDHELLSQNVSARFESERTFGQRLADAIATFGGSWSFLIVFGLFMATWMGINAFVLVTRAFDPYPFILLNLVLSCLAAIQAPVIMMSQNRQESRDRRRAEHDYQINLKAELEVRQLHEKLDHLIQNQWQRMMEIQQMQVDMLAELSERRN